MQDYIKQQYSIAMSDYQIARTDNDRHKALRDMARLEQLAASKVGFEFADSLRAVCR